MNRTASSRRTRLTWGETLLLATAGIGVLHHLDHVLRFDHSGWPFRPEVTEFTFSLVAYPLAALILLAPRDGLTRVIASGLLFLGPTTAHVAIETPAHQHATWAFQPDVNLLHATSHLLGGTAVLITVALSLTSLAAFLAFFRAWRSASRA